MAININHQVNQVNGLNISGSAGAGSTVGTAGIVTYYGDGSNLTGISAGGFEQDDQGNLVAGTGAGAAKDADTCFNIMIGCNSGAALNSGDKNILLGKDAGCSLTTGHNNNVVGHSALKSSTGGCYNVFFGSYAGMQAGNTISKSVAVGNAALMKLGCSGAAYCNTAIGANAGKCITTGCENFFGGYRAGGLGYVTGSGNVSIGNLSSEDLTSGSRNTVIGGCSGQNLTTGNCNVLIGNCVGMGVTTSSHDVIIGNKAMGNSAKSQGNNILIGDCAGYNHIFSNMIAIGNKAGYSVNQTYGWNNVLIGNCAGYCSITGQLNTYVGRDAGKCATGGTYNAYFGQSAGICATGNSNTMIGACAG